MKESVYIGDCPTGCGGWLEVLVNIESLQYCVRCDECLVQWKKPEDALNFINGYRNDCEWPDLRSATKDEVESIGWKEYIRE